MHQILTGFVLFVPSSLRYVTYFDVETLIMNVLLVKSRKTQNTGGGVIHSWGELLFP